MFPIELKDAFVLESVSASSRDSQKELLVELALQQHGTSNHQTVVVQKKKGKWPMIENLLEAVSQKRRLTCFLTFVPELGENLRIDFDSLFHIIEHAEVKKRGWRYMDSKQDIIHDSMFYVLFGQLYPVRIDKPDETSLTQLRVCLNKEQYESVISDTERSFTIRLWIDTEK